MRSELVYAPDGTVTGIRHAWTFDDMFSAFATQGIDSKKRGVFTREELDAARQDQRRVAQGLRLLHRGARSNGKKAEFIDPPSGYYLDYKDQILTLHFTLPFKTPVKAQDLEIEIYDPSYFVDFSFEKDTRSRWSARRPDASWWSRARRRWTPALAAKLFQMAPDQKLDPSQYLGAQFANRILVKCS